MGIEVGILFAFGAMLCWAFGDFFIQKCTRKIGDVESLAFIGIIGTIGLLPFVIKDFYLLKSLPNLVLLSFLGITTFIMALLDFEALKKGKLSIINVILEIELPVTIVLGFIFFKEYLSNLQFLIISFIFIGIILIATKSFSHWKTKLEKGVLLAFFAAIVMGIGNFLTSYSSRQISPLMAIWIPWVISMIMCLVLIYKRTDFSKLLKNSKKFKKIIIAMGIFDTLAWLFYAFATLNNKIAIITAITESYPAITIMLGVWFNKEKINWHQWLGAGIALAASITLAFLV